MEIREILQQLKKNDAHISLNSGNLKISSDKQDLPAGLLDAVKLHKEAIIGYLKSVESPAGSSITIPVADPSLPFYPCSSAQKRLCFLQQFAKGNTAYNMPMIHYLGETVQTENLRSAFQSLILRHESLRTFFVQVEGEIVQKIAANVHFTIEEHECSMPELPGYVQGFVRPFILSEAPLLRVSLVRLKAKGVLLLIDIHHILSDGISQQVLISDFFRFYRGGTLPPLRIQYKDFAVWQNSEEAHTRFEPQRAYWKSELAGTLPKFNFPADRARPPLFTFRGNNVHYVIPEALTEKIDSFNRNNRCTLQMTFLAVLNILYHKYNGQNDMITGLGISGRRFEELASVAGMFVNTLPVRNVLDKEQPFAAFHREVMKKSVSAFDNQDIQFEEMVEMVRTERDPSRNPIFDAALFVQNFEESAAPASHIPGDNDISGEIRNTITESMAKAAKLDMAWFVTQKNNTIIINLEYYSEIYERETMLRLLQHLTNIFEIVLNNPAVRIKDICLLKDDEQSVILSGFSPGRMQHYPPETTVHLLFDQQCLLTAEKIAVSDETGHYTYRQLKEESETLAGFLQHIGVHAESKTGILQKRTKESIASILAVSRTGGAYVPLDGDHPPARMQFILEDTGAEVLLVDRENVATGMLLQEHVEKIKHLVCIDTLDRTDAGQSFAGTFEGKHRYTRQEILKTGASPDDRPKVPSHNLAYIMYTSGSTGKPKGVMVEHKGIARLVKPADYLDLDGSEILLSTMAISFDFSVFEYWSMLLNGGHLIMCAKESLLNSTKLLAIMHLHKVNTMMLSTGLCNQFADSNPDIFCNLKTLLVGGEKLSLRHIQKLTAAFPGLTILNAYGPTEDTSIALTYTFSGIPEKILIGRPILNTSVYILDENHQVCPVGIPGEIYLGGSALARGYLNLEALTTEKFIPNPFVQNERVYKTGDIGRWLPDRNVEFLGRDDDQIKIRGFRVELAEIEQAVQDYHNIDTAVVIADNQSGDIQLKGYFVSPEIIDIHDLRQYLKNNLPFYMIPVFLFQVPKMPLTISGKVNKKELQLMVNEHEYEAEEEYIPPATTTQQQLVDMWKQLLERNKVGIYNSFFDLGGHSLKAMKLAGKINEIFEVEISLESLFANPTIAYMAREIDQINWATGVAPGHTDTERVLI